MPRSLHVLSLAALAAGALVAGAGGGCADSIRPDRPDAGPLPDASGDAGLVPTGTVTTGMNGDGSYTTIVDASATGEWIYVDLKARAQAEPTGPWDLRFQRFHISANGSVTGTGGVEVAPLPGAAFTDVTAPPAAGWITDAPDGADGNLDPDYAFEQGDGWYEYNPESHVLTPRPIVYVVKTNGGPVIKLAIRRYYDAAGTPGWLTFQWASL